MRGFTVEEADRYGDFVDNLFDTDEEGDSPSSAPAQSCAYVVVADHPYYPQVEYCESLAEAEERKSSLENDLLVDDGSKDCRIMILSPVKITEGKSHY